MKILHIGVQNFAGAPVSFSKAINKYTDHESIIVVATDNYLKYPADEIAISQAAFERIYHQCEVVVFHEEYSLRAWDCKNLEDKKVVLYAHGTYTRTNPEISDSFALKHNASVLCSTPDLVQYFNNGYWFPNPIDLTDSMYTPSGIKHPVISHCPTNRADKDTELFLKVCEESGLSYKLIEKTSNEECINLRRTCGFHYDQIKVGMYGVGAMEAAALGQVVFCGLNMERYKEFGVTPPFVNVNKVNLGSKMKEVIGNPERAGELASAGYSYVEVTHNAEYLANRFIEMVK